MPTRAERDRAVKMYTETRLPVGEIAKRMGVSRSSVHRWLQSAGVEPRGPLGPRKTYEGAEPRITLSESDALLQTVGDVIDRLDKLIAVMGEQTVAIRELMAERMRRYQHLDDDE